METLIYRCPFRRPVEPELREYGLSEKEIKVYLAALKLGPSTANRLSTATELRRSTTYDIIESLKAKGLLSTFLREKKQYFQAAEPVELLSLLHNKEEIIKRVLPQLEALKAAAGEKPKVQVFEGVRGVAAMLEQIYREKEMLVYGSAQKAAEALKHIPPSLAYRRAELGIKARMIFERSEQARYRIKDPMIRKVTSMKFLESMRGCPTVTWIAGNQVAIVTLEKEMVGVYIIGKAISQAQRLFFEILWKRAKP